MSARKGTFGERRYLLPYKMWLDEIKRQRGIAGRMKAERIARLDAARGQKSMFDDGDGK